MAIPKSCEDVVLVFSHLSNLPRSIVAPLPASFDVNICGAAPLAQSLGPQTGVVQGSEARRYAQRTYLVCVRKLTYTCSIVSWSQLQRAAKISHLSNLHLSIVAPLSRCSGV